MRLRNLLICLLLFGGCTEFSSKPLTVQSPADPIFAIFREDRSLADNPIPPNGRDQQIVQALHNSPIANAYAKIVPQRSILIFDCDQLAWSKWCAQPDFGLPAMFKAAARIAKPAQDAESLTAAWYKAATQPEMDSLISTEIPLGSLNRSFQPLAVANRLDLAQWKDNVYSGAEIHIAYGRIPGPGATSGPDFTLIVEFGLAPKDRQTFQRIASAWNDLSTVMPDKYSAALKRALQISGLPLEGGDRTDGILMVRIRVNHKVGGGLWRFTQLLLDPTSVNPAAFVPASLDDQIAEPVMSNQQAYRDLWFQAQTAFQAPGTISYHIPSQWIAKPSMPYDSPGLGMPMPMGICDASEGLRNKLALQQCNLCHTVESKTTFHHIPNRLVSDSSIPDGFLVGQSVKNIHPDLADLYYGNSDVVWLAPITYTTYSCSGASSEVKITRKFHDVGRRTLFLAAVLTDAGHGEPSATKFSTLLTE